jgi:hypothetical protein
MTDSVTMQAFPELKKEIDYLKKNTDFKFGITKTRSETLELMYGRLAFDTKAIEEVTEECSRRCFEAKEDLAKAATSIYSEISTLASYLRDAREKINEQEKKMNMMVERMERMEARFRRHETRYLEEMEKMEARFNEHEALHAKELKEINDMLGVEDASDISESESITEYFREENDFVAREKSRIQEEKMANEAGQFRKQMLENLKTSLGLYRLNDTELSEPPEEISDSIDWKFGVSSCISERFNSLNSEEARDLPIASSLSDMLYDTDYPSL